MDCNLENSTQLVHGSALHKKIIIIVDQLKPLQMPYTSNYLSIRSNINCTAVNRNRSMFFSSQQSHLASHIMIITNPIAITHKYFHTGTVQLSRAFNLNLQIGPCPLRPAHTAQYAFPFHSILRSYM